MPTTLTIRRLLKDYLLMTHALVKLQRRDGYWNASLVSTNYAGPEMTVRHCSSTEWHGVCATASSMPRSIVPCDKAWKALRSCVHANGFLGYNQGTGADPSTGQP